MHKRHAFENNHHLYGRAVVTAPAAAFTTAEKQVGNPNAAVNTQPAAAAATSSANRQNTTPAAAATTPKSNPAQDTNKDQNQNQNQNQNNNTPATVAAAAATNTVAAAPTATGAARGTTTPAAAVPTTSAAAQATSNANANANTVAAVHPTTSDSKPLTVTRTTKSSSSTSSSDLPSGPPDADNGPNVGAIAGYAAAALAGVAVISLFAIWFIRRRRRRRDADLDAAPFNRQSWLRNSAMIHDDALTPATDHFPPPRRDPEMMIDRSFNATPVTNYAGVNQYPQNDFGYAPQPSFQPGAVIFSPSSPSSFGPGGSPATPLPFSPHPSFGPGPSPATPGPLSPDYDNDPATPNPFEQHAGAGYTEVTRGGPSSPFNPYEQQHQFNDIQRQMTPSALNGDLPALPEDPPLSPRTPSPRVDAAPPVLPPIAANNASNTDSFSRVPAYPELSPAPTSALGQVVEMRASTYGHATNVQYGFADGPQSPVPVMSAPSTPTVPMAPQPPAPTALQPAGRTLTRPETVYDTEDAYGGI